MPRKNIKNREQPNAVVVLSGGAPNSPLAAGALYAIYDRGKTFNTFYTSGAGATVGLLFVAPAGNSTLEALRGVLKASIDDRIWNWFPLPYKAFFKSGPFDVLFADWAEALHIHHTKGKVGNDFQRFYNDWVDLWAAALCPTDLSFFSQGLCDPFPFIRDAVDFNKLKKFAGSFFMNALCIDNGEMVQFGKEAMGEEHFRAALAFPYVYPPAQIGDSCFFEGSCIDPLNLGKFVHYLQKLDIQPDIIVVIDLLGPFKRALIRKPRNIFDAFCISILTPTVSLAEMELALFACQRPDLKLTMLSFNVPERMYSTMSDWSHSNMHELFRIGREAGEQFCDQYGDLLPDHVSDGPDPV